MFQLIGAVVGLFSKYGAGQRQNYVNTMAYYDSEKRRLETEKQIYAIAEILIPLIVFGFLILFYIKVAKKWL